MIGRKTYDGKSVCIHIVRPGESYSRIASTYRLSSWHAIWQYNTKVQKVDLGNDPDKLNVGIQLFIPRSPDGYDQLITKLNQLKIEMQGFGDMEKYALEGQQWNYKASVEMFDFIGDVATTLTTFGLKAAQTAKAAKVAKATTGQGRVAAEYLAEKQAEKLSKWIMDTFKGKATGAAAKYADKAHGALAGKETMVGEKTHKYASTAKKAFGAVTGYSMIGGKALLDISDIALDYLSPSKLANVYLWATTGETVDETFNAQKRRIAATVSSSTQLLDQKIEKYLLEKKLVYSPTTKI